MGTSDSHGQEQLMCTYDYGDFFALFFLLFLIFLGGWGTGWNSGKREGFDAGYKRARSIALSELSFQTWKKRGK